MAPVSRCFSPQAQQEWLAVFRSPEFFRTYWLPRRFKEQVIVTRHFYLKPLLPFLTDDGHFFILAFSHNHIRLLEGGDARQRQRGCSARSCATEPGFGDEI